MDNNKKKGGDTMAKLPGVPVHDKEINGAVARRLSKEFDLGL